MSVKKEVFCYDRKIEWKKGNGGDLTFYGFICTFLPVYFCPQPNEYIYKERT